MQGVFKARHADRDEYLKYLFSYIHLNPVERIEPDWKETGIKDIKEAKNFLRSYAYSSYPDYCGSKRPERVLLNPRAFPEYFEHTTDFDAMINFWLNFSNTEMVKE